MKNPFAGRGLTSADRPGEVEYIIDGFLAKEAITLYFAPPKNGKSVMAFALSKHVHDNTGMHVQYFDFDNGTVALEDRGIFNIIDDLDKMDYLHPEKVTITSREALDKLLKFANEDGKPLLNYLLVFDSATDFVDAENNQAVKRFMLDLKALRNAGATVLLLHHLNKSERGYQGSLAFVSASDNVFIHRMVSETNASSVFTYEKDYGRFKGVRNVAFEVQRGDYSLKSLFYDQAIIKPDEQAFIDKVCKEIRKEPGIGQGKLLLASGYTKADKPAMGLLNKYLDRFWRIEKGTKNSKLYYEL